MAGWNAGGGKLDLPVSPHVYVFQVSDVKTIKGKDMGKGEKPRFQWSIDVWVNNQWERKTIYTGVEFCDVTKISSAQFVPELIKLTRACQRPIPQNAAEALAWDPNSLIGCRAGIRIMEEDGLVQKKFVQLEAQAPVQQVAAPLPQVAAPQVAPPPAPAAPVGPPPVAAAAPPPAPADVAHDPFVGDAGAIPATSAPAVPQLPHVPPPAATGADVWA